MNTVDMSSKRVKTTATTRQKRICDNQQHNLNHVKQYTHNAAVPYRRDISKTI